MNIPSGLIDLSVIICTHNPRSEWIGRVLKALRAQTLPADRWELLVIDNCSADPLEGRLDLRWQPASRILREDKLGLTPARLRGIREARGGLLVFVDDDNILDADYLEQAMRVASEMPWLGAWSGQCLPEFEVDPPEWTRRYWGNLAIRQFEKDVWSNVPSIGETMPLGAGLCIRKEVGQAYAQLHDNGMRRFQLDRSGSSLLSGGDIDMAACASTVGLGMGLVSAMRLVHLIPDNRLTVQYLERLSEGIAYSGVLLDMFWGTRPLKRGALRKLADFVRICRIRSPHRQIQRAAIRGRDRAIAQLTDAN